MAKRDLLDIVADTGRNAFWGGFQVGTSEAELRREIEALRDQLNGKAGDIYNRAKIQAAGQDSVLLDNLICRWINIHTKKRESR